MPTSLFLCRYDWHNREVKDIREGVLYPTHSALPQGSLLPLTLQDSVSCRRGAWTGRARENYGGAKADRTLVEAPYGQLKNGRIRPAEIGVPADGYPIALV
jgi:hypothetical protein